MIVVPMPFRENNRNLTVKELSGILRSHDKYCKEGHLVIIKPVDKEDIKHLLLFLRRCEEFSQDIHFFKGEIDYNIADDSWEYSCMHSLGNHKYGAMLTYRPQDDDIWFVFQKRGVGNLVSQSLKNATRDISPQVYLWIHEILKMYQNVTEKKMSENTKEMFQEYIEDVQEMDETVDVQELINRYEKNTGEKYSGKNTPERE